MKNTCSVFMLRTRIKTFNKIRNGSPRKTPRNQTVRKLRETGQFEKTARSRTKNFSNCLTLRNCARSDGSKNFAKLGGLESADATRNFLNCPTSRNCARKTTCPNFAQDLAFLQVRTSIWLHNKIQLFHECVIWSDFAMMSSCAKPDRSKFPRNRAVGKVLCTKPTKELFQLSGFAELCKVDRFEKNCEFGWFGKWKCCEEPFEPPGFVELFHARLICSDFAIRSSFFTNV